MISLVFQKWIKQRTGLAVTSQNFGSVELVLRQLEKKTGISSQDYAQGLMSGRLHAHAFIDAVTTHESYFFRHRESMDFVVNQLMPDWLHKQIQPRILSLPCAQGEEPYSLAMLLADKGFRPSQTAITGVDISTSSLALAKRGHYSQYALRRAPADAIGRHFLRSGEGFLITEHIRNYVSHFVHANLLTNLSNLLPGQFHVIFFQNLLIYFDDQDQQRALEILHDKLTPDGWLFVDATEAAVTSTQFARFELGGGRSAFRRKDTKERKPDYQSSLTSVGSIIPPPVSAFVPPEQGIFEPVSSVFTPVVRTIPQPSMEEKGQMLLADARKAYNDKTYDRAINLFDRLVVEYPSLAKYGYHGLAKAYADQGDDMAALEAADNALQSTVDIDVRQLTEIHAIIGLIMNNKGMKQAAQEHFQRIKSLDPGHPLAKRVVN